MLGLRGLFNQQIHGSKRSLFRPRCPVCNPSGALLVVNWPTTCCRRIDEDSEKATAMANVMMENPANKSGQANSFDAL
jgi:hypothetical protein